MASFTQLLLSALLLSAALAAGSKDDSISEPHRELQNFDARAYLCDNEYKELKNQQPLEGAEEFRVCVKPTTNTLNQDVSILKLNNFKFYMKRDADKTLTQEAIDAGTASDNSVLDCPGGKDKPCSFKTKLRENFYSQDGTVKGVGSVALQYNTAGGRRLNANTGTGTALRMATDHRQLQEFAGIVGVSIFFDIEDGFDKNKIKEARHQFKEHWNDQPAHVQGLYITGIFILLVIFVICCAGMILWRHCCADLPGNWVRREQDRDEIHVIPPVGVEKSTDDQSETYSLEEDDMMAGEVDEEEDYSSDEESHQPQSYISGQLEDETVVTEEGIVPYEFGDDRTTSRSRR